MSLRLVFASALALAAVLATGCESDSASSDPAEPVASVWTYEGESGPEHWGDINGEYELCEDGHRQSPINLTDPRRSSFPKITTDYRPGQVEVEDNGHAIEVAFKDPGSSISIDGTEYTLEQFHVHMPSEEQIDGRHFPATIHLVHISDEGEIAVIAVLVRPGPANPVFEFEVPENTGEATELQGKVDPEALLPESDLAYRYQGSLTTPPCTEGVTWTVFQQPIALSPAQLNSLRSAHDGNNRPVEPLEERQVLFGPALAN